MIIRELYLKSFGKFSETKIELEEGFHIFYGENEFGKSTLHAFIRSMLFGLTKGRGRAAKMICLQNMSRGISRLTMRER